MAGPDADDSWLYRLFHPAPIVAVGAAPAECGRVTVEAKARRKNARITLRGGGTELAAGVGSVSWTGFVDGDRVFAEVAGRKGGAAEVVVPPASVPVTVTMTPPAEVFPYVPASIAVLRTDAAGCAAEPVQLVVQADGRPFRDMALTKPETLGPAMDPGAHVVTATATWRGRVVASEQWTFVVPSPAFDLDEDGATDAEDCDDHDPLVRPGLPDVLGDGLDNDCDGKNAGDADGDGYAAPRDVALTAAEKDKITAVYGVGAAARIEAWGRRDTLAPDCNDKDASVHPFARTAAKACKKPVTVEMRPGTPARTPDAALVLGTAIGGKGLQAEIQTAGPTWYAAHVTGATNAQDLKLKVELEGGDYWLEVWDGGAWSGREAGPLAQLRPILEIRSEREIRRPPAKEGTWTGGLWRAATNAGGWTGLAMLGAAALTPFTALADASDASARETARVRGRIANDSLIYVRVVPVGPGERHGDLSLSP